MTSYNSCENIELQNPQEKPLENLHLLIKDGLFTREIPALDKLWIEKRKFLNYEAPKLIDPHGKCIVGAKERWIELASFILDDLTWLLQLSPHKFWSNIIYNPSIINSIIIFLQEAPTLFTLKSFPDDHDLKKLFDNIRQNVLIIFARLVTNRESSFEYISSSEHAYLLYNKFIFTIPILMDLCQQYGRDNKKIVKKIVNSVFTIQPLYKDDLGKAVTFIIQVLKNVERKFDDYLVHPDGKAIPLSERVIVNTEISSSDLEDTVLYLVDIISTISAFIDIYPSAVIFFKKELFLMRIISVYSNAIPKIYKKLENFACKDKSLEKYLEVKYFVDVIRVEILNIYRKVIYSSIEDITKNKNVVSSMEIGNIVEDFLSNLMLTLSEKEFVIDYYNLYPVMDDFQVLLKLYSDLDTVKFEFIINSIFSLLDESAQIKSCNFITEDLGSTINHKNTASNNKLLEMSDEINFDCSSSTNVKSETDKISLILKVKDILCDLGEGFIEKCLSYYNNNTESVINAVLEDSLPAELKSLDWTLPIIPPDLDEASATVDAAIGVQRLNIYDNDEFDIMTRDSVDLSKIHRGKRKDKYKNFNELLNDKSHLVETKDIYNKYSVVSNEYDDEYDDTYDDHDIRSSIQDDIVEVEGRPFTIPRVFYKQESNDLKDVEDNDSEDVINTKTDHFLQDPALLRAKMEERRLRNSKGQSQIKEVIDSRNQKNKQKSSRANHNRRSGSQWKRNQGMVPS